MVENKKDTQQGDDNEIRYVNLYESEAKIYTRKVSGYFQRLRRYSGAFLMLGFLLMPWLVIDGRPAILFDIPKREFHVLFVTFASQDLMLLAWTLMIAAFGLFAVTATLGRVWCGFTCPQTVWTLMFIWVESFCEGDRNKRIKLDQRSMDREKFLRKAAKHSLWLLIAFVTGATFIGYFLPIRELLVGLIPAVSSGGIEWSIPASAVFFTFLFTGFTYLNAGWMREQVCKYMCPYARFQAVMYDRDTLYVQYDPKRGESRGPRKASADYKAEGLGDCIDCSWCVQVCPVDIDIREGTQYECINCGLCVDACDAIMDKMEYPRGLISFTSEDALETGKTRFFRPRVIGYYSILLIMVGFLITALNTRLPIAVDVERDRGRNMFRVQGQSIQNVYSVMITNMDRRTHSYRLELEGALDYTLGKGHVMELKEGENRTYSVRVSAPYKALSKAKNDLRIIVTSELDSSISAAENTVFMAPAPKK